MASKRQSYAVILIAALLVVFAVIQFQLNARVSREEPTTVISAKLASFKSPKTTTASSENNNNKHGELATTSFTCPDDNDDKTQGPCCSSWETNMDDWWTHHPDWYVSHESNDQFCFSRIQDQVKAAFFRRVHDIQWNHNATSNCDNVILANQTNAGYAACSNQIVYGFHAAYQRSLPFQISKHRPQMTWMFAPKNESSWAYCESMDMNCYFLPLSDCPAQIGGYQKYHAEVPNSKQGNREYQWLRIYAARPKQHVRRKVYEYITQVQGLPPLPWNNSSDCTAMHVRRGDSGFVKFPWRRYAAVQEYIDKAKIQPGETIVLLSDDISTIEEVEKYHATKYNWIYLRRKRFRGTEGGFSKHIPSGDEALEVVTIMAEVRLAAQCSKLVTGNSGFVTQIKDALETAGTAYKQYTVQTRVKEADIKKDKKLNHTVRVEMMLKEIDAKNNDGGA